MVNLGNPDLAFQTARLPNDGVGLARMEFIISRITSRRTRWRSSIPSASTDAAERGRIARLIRQLSRRRRRFFVERLAEGVGTIAAAFYPRPVIVRLSDFKTNEYATLIGGRWFEPVEENPMLGLPRRRALCPPAPTRKASRWNAQALTPRARGRWG